MGAPAAPAPGPPEAARGQKGRPMLNFQYDAQTIAEKRALLRKTLLVHADGIRGGDPAKISGYDLRLMFMLYDELFFRGFFHGCGCENVRFSVSRQMTRSAGLTRFSRDYFALPPEKREIELKISLNHLEAFGQTAREKHVGGIPARDELDALMLVFEHELCHIAEFLAFGSTSCRGKRFKALSSCIFGHKSSVHDLPSRPELNVLRSGLNAGDRVSFEYNGRKITGVIARINKRATVMAQARNGLYADREGRRYAKYLVPLAQMRKL